MTKRCLLTLLGLLIGTPAYAATGLGDFPVAATVYCPWTSNAQTGASITRSTNGTVSVYHSANLTQSTTGVTDGEDHDGLTGVHMVTIDTSADGTFYAAGREFSVVLSAATIDTLTVNSVLCVFSLERTNGALAMLKARTPNAAAGASGGLLISGSNSGTTTLAALTITGTTTHTGTTVHTGHVSYVDGIAIAAPSTTNRAGFATAGNGTGAGFIATGGATGIGVSAVGGSSSGSGIKSVGTAGNAIALELAGQGSASGLSTTGGATGHGVTAVGGATSGNGINAVASTSGTGITATGVGTTKAGIAATGGATTSAGISATGGATSGDGILAVAPTSGIGVVATGGGTTKPGIQATGGATTSAGLSLVGGGTSGAGLLVATTSGDGMTIAPTAGHGINIAANGTSKHGITATGGGAGTSDGIKATAGSGGVDLRAGTGITVDGCTGCSAAGGVTIMPNDAIVKDATSVIRNVIIRDSTTQAGKTGLLFSDVTAKRCRVDEGNAACTTITLQTATRGSWTTRGLIQKDSTGCPGCYEFGVPNDAIATGAAEVYFTFTASGALPTYLPLALTDTTMAALGTLIGTPAGASVSADIAAEAIKTTAVKAKTDSLTFTGANLGSIVNAYASGQGPLQPTVAGRTLDVTATGAAGVDWANVENPTTTLALTGTTISTGQTITSAGTVTTVTNLTNAPTAGDLTATMKTSVTTAATAATPTIAGTASGAITATSIAADAIGASELAASAADKIGDDVIARFPAQIANMLISAGGIVTSGGTYRRNVASQVYPVFLVDSDGAAVTGASVTVKLSKDGAAAAAIAGSVGEIDAGDIPGWYLVSFAQADTDCGLCIYKATAAGVTPRAFYFTTAP